MGAESETAATVVCSTVHKAKGLGWPSVLLLDDFLCTRGDARDRISVEEVNICYVALSRVSTRALYLSFDPLPNMHSQRAPFHPHMLDDFDEFFLDVFDDGFDSGEGENSEDVDEG